MYKWPRKGSTGNAGLNHCRKERSNSGCISLGLQEFNSKISLRKTSVGSLAGSPTEQGDADQNYRLELAQLKASVAQQANKERKDRRLSLASDLRQISCIGNNDGSLKLSPLSKDPRSWSREDVSTWLGQTVRRNSLPYVSPHSFKMNGKGLSFLTMEMFSARAPCGGKTLFKDFQLRLTDAIYDVSRNNNISETGTT